MNTALISLYFHFALVERMGSPCQYIQVFRLLLSLPLHRYAVHICPVAVAQCYLIRLSPLHSRQVVCLCKIFTSYLVENASFVRLDTYISRIFICQTYSPPVTSASHLPACVRDHARGAGEFEENEIMR